MTKGDCFLAGRPMPDAPAHAMTAHKALIGVASGKTNFSSSWQPHTGRSSAGRVTPRAPSLAAPCSTTRSPALSGVQALSEVQRGSVGASTQLGPLRGSTMSAAIEQPLPQALQGDVQELQQQQPGPPTAAPGQHGADKQAPGQFGAQDELKAAANGEHVAARARAGGAAVHQVGRCGRRLVRAPPEPRCTGRTPGSRFLLGRHTLSQCCSAQLQWWGRLH